MNRCYLIRMGLALTLAGLLILGMLGTLRAVAPPRPENVAYEVWEATQGGAETDVLVILQEQADVSAARRLSGREERLSFVYDALRTTALRSQAALRAELEGKGVRYRSFYILNMLSLRVDRELAMQIAARQDVGRIVANPRVQIDLPEPGSITVRSQAAAGIEWNLTQINADDVWDLGYTGEGIVIAGQDTGYDWDHPALIDQYRGYNGVTATHDYNWHDAIHRPGSDCDADSPFPCDDTGHGTHTMGTMVGDDDAGNQIGVAPGAQWIGCRNMDEGLGSPATYAECFEFFLAPYPVAGDPFTDGEPSLAPHVVNNSWTCPPYEGCEPDTLRTMVENIRAAGIVVVASAGNSGSRCGTVQDPPAIYDATFSVGATDRADDVARFSSRGPVTVDGSGRLKPDVSAPGVSVRSSVPGTGYGWKSGTSMAGPHVAGTLALLWSAAPELIGDVDATEWTVTRAARPKTTTQGCGGDGADDVPNNVYGWGIVDVLSAVQGALSKPVLAKRVDVPAGLWVRALDYTLVVSNTSPFTLTDLVLTDTVPISTTFLSASGDYVYDGDVVTWTASSLGPWQVLTAGLKVFVGHLPSGSHVINADYGVRADAFTPVEGAPVETIIPWRYLLLPVLKNGQLEQSING